MSNMREKFNKESEVFFFFLRKMLKIKTRVESEKQWSGQWSGWKDDI